VADTFCPNGFSAFFIGPVDNDSGGLRSVSHEFICVEQ